MRATSASRGWDWPAAFLFTLALLTALARLSITRWAPNLERVQGVALAGALLGMVLGISRFRPRSAFLIALGYSAVFLPWHWARFLSERIDLRERVLSALGRLLFGWGEFFSGHAVEDRFFFVAVLVLVYWCIAVGSAYRMMRYRDSLAATLPIGVAIFVVQMNDPRPPSRIWFMAFFLILALTLVARLHYLHNREGWQKMGVVLPPEAGVDITGGALTVATILIFFAWLLPPVLSRFPPAAEVWNGVSRSWRQVNDRLSDLFAAARPSRQVIGREFYGDRLPLGTAILLNENPVFTVHVNPAQVSPPRYYWRARAYDRYQDAHWITTADERLTFLAEQEYIPVPLPPSHAVAEFAFTYQQEQIALYSVSQPLWFSRPASLRVFPLPDGRADVVAVHAGEPVGAGETYRLRAALTFPTVAELRAAGEDYPSWVVERYFQLPEDFSPRLRALAQTVAGDLDTPYDRAAAITTYLRREIRYAERIPPPPPDVDPVEWVLFDLKEGFCNYYASAEVLLLRSLGVPARLAVGFAEGSHDPRTGTYTVRQRDAHAWPEVYFPGIGWVEFEPTASRRPLVRPRGGIRPEEEEKRVLRGGILSRNGLGDENIKGVSRKGRGSSPLAFSLAYWLFPLVLGVAMLALWYGNRRLAWADRLPLHLERALARRGMETPAWLERWARGARRTPIERAFRVINWGLRALGNPPPLHATPARRAEMLEMLLPQARREIEALLEEHQRDLYSPRPGDAERAWRAARSIRMALIRGRVGRFWGTLKGRFFS